MAGALVKHIVRLDRPSDAMAAVADAYQAAAAGEPGPVMLEIGPGVMSAPAQARSIPPSRPVMDPAAGGIEALVGRLEDAPRVLLYIGGGAAGATEQVRTLVRMIGAAVVTTTSGRGVVPEDDPAVVIRDTGLGCQDVLNRLARKADLVVALGCKFSHNGAAGFALSLDSRKLVTVNTGGPSRNYPAHLHLTADVGQVLARVLPRLSHRDSMVGGWDRADLAESRADSDARKALPEPQVSGLSATAADVVRQIAGLLPSDAIVVTDSGLHQMCVRRHLRVESPHGLLVPANFQSMGFALPAAIGAAMAAPSRRVVAIVGDGGMMMSGLELATAVRERIDLTVIVFNDAAYGLIRQSQLLDYGTAHGTELSNPDFEALANALGAEYRSCVPDGVAAALAGRPGRPGVRLVEVPLQDAPSMRRARALGVARRMARGMLPTRGRSVIRRWLRR
jgi:acetolactate synthase-1/2/3 large subunit